MSYKAFIEADCTEPSHLKRLLELDSKKLCNDRSSFSVMINKRKIEVCIKAQDAVALRASANTVMKILTVYEKSKKV